MNSKATIEFTEGHKFKIVHDILVDLWQGNEFTPKEILTFLEIEIETCLYVMKKHNIEVDKK